MREAKGYITEDGTFFVSQPEAELHEAELRLRAKLSIEYPDLSQGKLFEVVTQLIDDVGEYINAYQAANKRDPAESEVGEEIRDSEPAKVDDSLGHISSTEKDLTALLKLPSRMERDTGMGELPSKQRRKGPLPHSSG
jgi:hypothetical protein